MEDGKNIWRQAEMKKKSVCSLATSGNETREKKNRYVVWRKAEIKQSLCTSYIPNTYLRYK